MRLDITAPMLFLKSSSPIAFCMMSTIYLALLCLLYPTINIPLLRVMSFIVIPVSVVAISLGFFFEDRERGSALVSHPFAYAYHFWLWVLVRDEAKSEI